jgi:hypothetical protein
MVMVAACLLLTAWFAWWRADGIQLASGWADMSVELQTLELIFPGPAAAHHAMLYGISVWFQAFAALVQPVALTAVGALWCVPLLAWTSGVVTGGRRRTTEVPSGAEDPEVLRTALPPVRELLLAAGAGGVACWAAVAIAKVHMHTWQPPQGQRGGLYSLILAAWVVVCLAVVSAAVAIAATARVRRYRLLITLITAEVSALIGLFGYFVLMSSDGCVQPMSTLASRCYWLPSGAWPVLEMVLGPVLVSTALLAIVAAAIVSVVLRRRGTGRQRAAFVQPHEHRRGLRARRVAVSIVCAVAVGATATAATYESSSASGQQPDAAYSGLRQIAPTSAATRSLQTNAWLLVGGRDLIQRYAHTEAQLGEILHQAADAGGKLDSSVFDPVCAGFDRLGQDAARYFPIPDPQAESLWQTFIRQAQAGGKDCLLGFAQQDEKRFMASMKEFVDAGESLRAAEARIQVVHAAYRQPSIGPFPAGSRS